MSMFSSLRVDFKSFWKALGPRLGRFGGQNGVQERWNPWRKTIFFSLWSFLCPKFGFSLIWEGLGKVLGVFGEDFGGFGGRFLEVLKNTSLVFGNGSSHAFQNNHAAKMIKQEQVAPLEACVASLRAVLIYNLSTFWSFRDTMFLYSIFYWNWGLWLP